MAQTLFTNIDYLVQIASKPASIPRKGSHMADLPHIRNGWLLVEDGRFKDFGTMDLLPQTNAVKIIDVNGGAVFPTWVDPHTHIVFDGSREQEFVYKIKNMSYEEIARAGGGILNSAAKLRAASEEQLYNQAAARIIEMIGFGTGAIEIKSGYGLTVYDELKMLKVARKLSENFPVTIKKTLLGAHAIPVEYKENRAAYVDLVCNEMIPQAVDQQLADYVDVFCDKGFFTTAETDQILNAAAKFGLKAKIHANELDYSGGIQVAAKHNAVSVDHLEYTGEEEINALLRVDTIPTLLPSTAFYLHLIQPPARDMIKAGLPLALATDYNPGSSPSGNMPFIIALACINLRLLPEEAINAATLNAAFALELQHTHGSIVPGFPANFFITHPIPSLAYIPYRFGNNPVKETWLNGVKFSH